MLGSSTPPITSPPSRRSPWKLGLSDSRPDLWDAHLAEQRQVVLDVPVSRCGGCLVDFDEAGERRAARRDHGAAQLGARGLVGAEPELLLQLQASALR